MLSKTIKETFFKQKIPYNKYGNLILNTMVKNPVIVFEFNNVKRTGTFFKKKIYNQLFLKIKQNLYAPIIHTVNILSELDRIKHHHKSKEKVIKYYTDKIYNNIKRVHIIGEDPYMALPHILAYWPDYDLIKPYFKKAPIEKIDKTLWGFYFAEHFLSSHNIFPDKKEFNTLDTKERLFQTTQRFNMWGYIRLTYSAFYLPVFYKDGVLITKYFDPLTNLQNFDKPTTKEVIKTICKNIANPKYIEQFIKLNWTEILVYGSMHTIFPYSFTIGITDYGYVVNLYKFNLNILRYELIGIKPVCADHSIFDTSAEVLNSEKCITGDKTTIDKNKSKYPYNYPYNFGVDNKYIYLTTGLWDNKQKPHRVNIHIYKIPIEKARRVKRKYLNSVIEWKGDFGKTELQILNLEEGTEITFSNNP